MTPSASRHSSPVPWAVERAGAHPIVTNASDEPLEYVKALVFDGNERLHAESWGLVLPGDHSELCLCGIEPSDASVALIWFRAGDNQELLWRFVL
ncbi:hypothetical protein [Microbacterium amylolyticum]|uniref:Uncharacterized protein n=1 Tax=Microbacterium amylolyticum TaxID=936337 RepID=A0ABS4ZLC1_9MICO|nr:hypothetical protein [Microbacterium amylolyticum]MBP2437798.1 hypothetical protein [Microbacterium amylolyticum]